MNKLKTTLAALCLCLLFFSCTKEQKQSQNEIPSKQQTSPVKTVSNSGTEQMVKLLNSAHQNIDPIKVTYHLNSSRADFYRQQSENAPNDGVYLQARFTFSNELIKAGKTEEAIQELEKLISIGEAKKFPSEQIYSAKQLLALAYLRLGEQNNCIGKNNEASCIIPIQGKGIYSMKSGSKTAISIYEKLLKENPTDYNSIWLLNIAYMTIGEYPGSVPRKWLIPVNNFESNYDLPPFKNIVNKTNVGSSALAGGACIEDFNNDGLLDIVASSWGVNDQIRVFLNLGNGNFKDQTEQSGLKGITGGLNMIHADYNNDGFEDILVLRGAWYYEQGTIPNSLLRNNGDGTFSDVTIEVGLLSKHPTQAATWADFNLDGWIDLFIGNESTDRHQATSELYINNQGRFENKTAEVGLKNAKAMVKGVCSGDIDNDGWPEIYISTLNRSNILLKNRGLIEGTNLIKFQDISTHAKTKEPFQSFPTWMWDYNNDGFLDIFAAAFTTGNFDSPAILVQHTKGNITHSARPRVYKNNGDHTFDETGVSMGLTEPVFAMGSNFGDIDNDGFSDFYLGSGEPDMMALVPNKMYRNNNGGSFQDVTYSGRFGHIQKGHGVSFGDFDNDGDQDIFHVLGGAYEGDIFSDALFENPVGNQKNWVTLLLKGTTANKSAIGARIKITTTNKNGSTSSFHHVVSTGGSFGSNSLQQEMGIGDATKINNIEIIWPNRNQTKEVFKNVKLNSFIKITEGTGTLEYQERKRFTF